MQYRIQQAGKVSLLGLGAILMAVFVAACSFAGATNPVPAHENSSSNQDFERRIQRLENRYLKWLIVIVSISIVVVTLGCGPQFKNSGDVIRALDKHTLANSKSENGRTWGFADNVDGINALGGIPSSCSSSFVVPQNYTITMCFFGPNEELEGTRISADVQSYYGKNGLSLTASGSSPSDFELLLEDLRDGEQRDKK